MTTATVNDFYEVLGVSKDAPKEEIRKAYLKLAHKYHPDKTGGNKAAEEKLKTINEAYDTLKNPEKRKLYDEQRAGAAAGFDFGGGFNGGAQDFGGFGFGAQEGGFGSSFEDLFGSIFGGGRSARDTVQPGGDLETEAAVTLHEVRTGTSRTIRVPRRETCGDCLGKGYAPGHEPRTCADCRGTGRTQRAKGAFSMTTTCPQCRGTGQILTDPCKRCGGQGRVHVNRELSVTIPPGVPSGMRLRLAGEGEAGVHGGPRGDLYVYINVAPHEQFTREGDDVTVEAPVTMTQAALGAKVRVPTLGGMAELSIPEGTQHGDTLRMRGLGLPRFHGTGKGDQLVRVAIEIPKRLSKRQKEVLTQLAETDEPHNYPLHNRFIERLKRK
ncbi:MAG: molecular chaperone DnaJ [Candidatus Hydrogenedentes bacterium]|nr:molecular chaperone DnaJ [Candidatus Hydrogenedentota bacterium]